MLLRSIISSLILGFSSASFAASALFCREVDSDGSFGQPMGDRKHCVEIDFDAETLYDDATTFFGNPPEQLVFQMNDQGVIKVLRYSKWEFAYVLSRDGRSLKNSAGAVLNRQ